MIKKYTDRLYFYTLILFSGLLLPGSVLAQGDGDSAGNPFLSIPIRSPISATNTVEGVIMIILNALITIAIPIIVLMIVYAGFLYVTARGNAEQVKKATTALTYAVIGGILVIGAVAITGIMSATLCEFRPDGAAGCS